MIIGVIHRPSHEVFILLTIYCEFVGPRYMLQTLKGQVTELQTPLF